MSSQTIRLLISNDAVIGYLAGVVGILVIGTVAAVRPRPVPIGGVVLAVSGVLAFSRIYEAPVELILGLGLLVVAGMLREPSIVGTMALCLPGAAALGYTFVDLDAPELIVLVVVGVTLLGALVARFDESHRDGTGITLMVIAYGAVMALVPDTDWLVLVFAAALPSLLVGYPLRLARLGKPGALGATGLLLWMAASGGVARPETVVASAGVLGLLVAAPVAQLLSRRGAAEVAGRKRPWVAVGIQLLIAATLGLVVRAGSEIVVVAVAVVVVLVGAGWWARATG